MKITGELLKSERMQKNLSIQDVAFALKLSPKIITAIEAGQIDNLPAKTFIRGFVKSYAQFLKMDAEQVMRQFQEEMGSTHPLPKNPPPQPMSENFTKKTEVRVEKKQVAAAAAEQTKVLNQTKSNRSIAYIGIAVVLVILIVVINRVSDRYQKESILNPNDISKVQPLDPNQTQVPVTEPSAAVPSTDTTAAAGLSESTTATTEVKQIATPTATTPIVATSTPPNVAIDTEEGFDPTNGKPIEVIVEAKKDVEIMYAKGNSKAFSKIKLLSKQVQVIRSPSGLYLKSDDGGSFHIVVNGIDKGQAGANNKPVKLSF